MHLELPLEQLVTRRGTAFQFVFAAEARELVPQADSFAVSASRRGLHVLGQNEDSLERPVEVLREAYGESLVIEPPKVRLIAGPQLREPIMHLRISMHTRLRQAVKGALLERGATLTEEYARSTYCVLRYEAPLADLLGFPAELAHLSAGAAKHWITLSHYAVVTRDPGGKAA